jgi:glycosyltransferase involved in cell wall biosynthesis
MKPGILFILHLPPPVHGAGLMGNYIRQNERINENFECDYINLSASKNVETIGKLNIKKFLFFFKLLLSVTKALVRKKYNLCYVSISSKGSGFYKDLCVVTLLKLFRKKIVLHFHNKGVAEAVKKNGFHRQMYRFVLGGTKTKIILLSERLYQDIKDYVKKENVFYCPNGIPDVNNINRVYNRDIKGPARLLFLSNMMHAKGVYVLVEGCSILKSRGHSFECHFVGDWLDIEEASFNTKVSDSGLSNFIYSHGKKFNEEKKLFYQRSDIFVFPTLNEAFGLVLLEAMQTGLPVVASDEGGIPDIVADQQTGFIVPKNDPVQLADKLSLLINNPPLCETLGSAGKKRFKDHFTLQKFENRFIHILQEVTGRTL